MDGRPQRLPRDMPEIVDLTESAPSSPRTSSAPRSFGSAKDLEKYKMTRYELQKFSLAINNNDPAIKPESVAKICKRLEVPEQKLKEWYNGDKLCTAVTDQLYEKLWNMVTLGWIKISLANSVVFENARRKPEEKPQAVSQGKRKAENDCEGSTCSICWEKFTSPASLKCGHVFCLECINMATAKKKQCPTCRQSMKKNDIRKIFW